MSSLNIKLKWAQNKLQAETEAHKVSSAPGREKRRKGVERAHVEMLTLGGMFL